VPVTFTPGTTSGATITVCPDPEAAWLASCPQATVTFSTAMSNLTAVTTATVATMTDFARSWVPDCAPYNTAGWTRGDTGRLLAEDREETERREAARQVADARAHVLLLSLLTADQAETYRRHGWFVVLGSAGGWYRIRNQGQAGNVDELTEDGQVTATWCCHPPGDLPVADAHVAQLLQLQADEPGFRETGNRTPRLPASRPLVTV
jgi:hypothetical protein